MAFAGNIPVGYLRSPQSLCEWQGVPCRAWCSKHGGTLTGTLKWDADNPQTVCSRTGCHWHYAVVRRTLQAMISWDADRSHDMCGSEGKYLVAGGVWSWHSTGASRSDVLHWGLGTYWGMSCCRRSLIRVAVTGFPCRQQSGHVVQCCTTSLKFGMGTSPGQCPWVEKQSQWVTLHSPSAAAVD